MKSIKIVIFFSILILCGCNNDTKITDDDIFFTDVDLGLSVNWANMNLGAERPEDFGKYYPLGDVKPYDTIPWLSFEFNPIPRLFFECDDVFFDSIFNKAGSPLHKKKTRPYPSSAYEYLYYARSRVLPKHDAATYQYGKMWRIPTYAEWRELLRNCKWEWIKNNEVEGYRVTGSNGNAIFLPAAGSKVDGYEIDNYNPHGVYWTADRFERGLGVTVNFIKNKDKNHIYINSYPWGETSKDDIYISYRDILIPISIRPVKIKKSTHRNVDQKTTQKKHKKAILIQ